MFPITSILPVHSFFGLLRKKHNKKKKKAAFGSGWNTPGEKKHCSFNVIKEQSSAFELMALGVMISCIEMERGKNNNIPSATTDETH